MKIKNEGDVIQYIGVILGIIGFAVGIIEIMYAGAVLCLLRNIYDLFFGKLTPVIDAMVIFMMYFFTKDLISGITYGTILGNASEVILVNIIWFTKKRAYEEVANRE